MKKLTVYILAFVSLILSGFGVASAASGDLFIYPSPPDSMQHLDSRCNFIVSRFWDRCNFDLAQRSPEKFNEAFGDWIAIIPHATADTVYSSVDRLLTRFKKNGPITLSLAQMAENWLYCDTAQYSSTELYLPFARAAANCKKVPKADRARFESHVKIIESSSVGAIVPDIKYVKVDGSNGSLGELTAGSILLFFTDPDCVDCSLAKVRLSTDPNTKELIAKGELNVVSIYPGDADSDAWTRLKDGAPAEWLTVAMPEAYDYFDIRTTPKFIFLNSKHTVLASDLSIDYLLGAFRVANQAQKRTNEH